MGQLAPLFVVFGLWRVRYPPPPRLPLRSPQRRHQRSCPGHSVEATGIPGRRPA